MTINIITIAPKVVTEDLLLKDDYNDDEDQKVFTMRRVQPEGTTSEIIERVCRILDSICQSDVIIKETMGQGGFLYGSIIWRVLWQLSPRETDFEVIKKVLNCYKQHKFDIDILNSITHLFSIPRARHVKDVHNDICDYYLAYPLQNRLNIRAYKAIQEVMAKNDTPDLQLVHDILDNIKKQGSVGIRSISEQRFLQFKERAFRIDVQIHYTEEPYQLLTDDAAPFFTAETLIYSETFKEGLRCRFHDNIESVLTDICTGTLRLINSAEIEKYLRKRPIPFSMFVNRRFKYSKYGYRLAYTAEDLTYKFICKAIEHLHTDHLQKLTEVQRYYIAKNQVYGIKVTKRNSNVYTLSPRTIKKLELIRRDNALVAQSLYQNYVAACVVHFTNGALRDNAQLIAEYAACANEEAYSEDKTHRSKLRGIEIEAEMKKKPILRILAGYLPENVSFTHPYNESKYSDEEAELDEHGSNTEQPDGKMNDEDEIDEEEFNAPNEEPEEDEFDEPTVRKVYRKAPPKNGKPPPKKNNPLPKKILSNPR